MPLIGSLILVAMPALTVALGLSLIMVSRVTGQSILKVTGRPLCLFHVDRRVDDRPHSRDTFIAAS